MQRHRQIVLDTELTGLDLDSGDRVIAVGLVEIFDYAVMGQCREWLINPMGRKSHPDALKIHGLSDEFLALQKSFFDSGREIRRFIGNSEIIHHCWYDKTTGRSTDQEMMNMEFEKIWIPAIADGQWINIKKWAQQINPDNNSLDAMLDHYCIDRQSRDKFHGALIDAKLTAAYYKEISRDFVKP